MTIEKLKKAREEYNALLKNEGKNILIGEFKKFFDDFPLAQQIKWEQYAPNFNDGNPCVFHVREYTAAALLEGAEGFIVSEEVESLTPAAGEKYGKTDESHPSVALETLLVDLVQQVGEDVFRTVFGADTEVVISRDLTVSCEYVEHD